MDIAEALELDFESVVRETDKAYQVKFDATTIIWMPKSQLRIMDNILYAPKWLVEKNELKQFIID